MTTTERTARRAKREKRQGMNWIRQEKRLAIYLRDGMACCYCNAKVEDGATLSLDHVVPHIEGGSNAADNLVTACTRCNSSRGTRDVLAFVASVASYLNHGITAEQITNHLAECVARPIDVPAAREIMARRRAEKE